MKWNYFNRTLSSIPPSDGGGEDPPPTDQKGQPPNQPEMSGQTVTPTTLQKAPGIQIPPFLLLEHEDLLKKFVELQERIGEQEPRKQIDLLKGEVAQFEDSIPGLQYKLGGTSHRHRSRLDIAKQNCADLEWRNKKLSERISELEGSARHEILRTELLQKKIVQLESEKETQAKELESQLQSHESTTKALTAEKEKLSDRVAELQTNAKKDRQQLEVLEKKNVQSESDRKTQLQKLESELQSHESEINRLKDENAAFSEQLLQARNRARDAHGSVENAQQNTERAEDAYMDLQMQKDQAELSREYGQKQATTVAKQLQDMDSIVEQQSAQIYRLEVDLEDMYTLEEENQELKEKNQELKEKHQTSDEENQKLRAALETGGQITLGSDVDEATRQWVLRARNESLELERDLGLLEAAWYGDEEATRIVPLTTSSLPQQNVQEQDSDSKSLEQSRQSSDVGEPRSMADWQREVGSYPPSAGFESWRNSQSQPGTRPGSRLGYGTAYTPSLHSRPTSLLGNSKPLPSARLALVSRGTDAPSQRPNRHSLQSRPPSRAHSLSRDQSLASVPSLADLARKRDQENFLAYLPHNREVPLPPKSQESPKPPSAAQYQPGMASRDFAVAAADSSQKSLAFYRHNGLRIVEQASAPVRPLHRGRRASLSTISERSGSFVFSPRRSDSRIQGWLDEDEYKNTRSREMGTQTDIEVATAPETNVDQLSQNLVFDQGTQTESFTLVTPYPVLTCDQETQTAFEDAPKAVIDERSPSVPPAPVYHSEDTQSNAGTVLDPELNIPLYEAPITASRHNESQPTLSHQSTQSTDVHTATMLPELVIEEALFQSDTSPPKADRGTAMTPKELSFEHNSVQTRGSVAFSSVEPSTQTEFVHVAELPASMPFTSGYEQDSTSRPLSAETAPRTPRSRVAATAQLFEKVGSNRKGAGVKVALLTPRGTQSPASKGPSVTTPTKLSTDSPHLPFARTDALARSLRPGSDAKHSGGGEHQGAKQEAAALRAKEENAITIQVLPAKAYQEEQSLTTSAHPPTPDTGVQTPPKEAPFIQTLVPAPSQVRQGYARSESTFDATDISPESTTIIWETPDDNPYPTPGFYTAPWRSPVTPDYSGLEVVTEGSFSDSEKVLVTTAEEDSPVAEPGIPEVDEVTPVPPEDFARTALPSSGEIDSESDESDEEDATLFTPDRGQSEDLSQTAAFREPSGSEIDDPIDLPPSHKASPGPVEAPADEVIPTVKQLTHTSRPSTSPVSPEDAWQLQVVKFDNPNTLPSPEPRFSGIPSEAEQEHSDLVGERTRKGRPVVRSLILPPAGSPMLLDSPVVPFPAFDDQLFESPIAYTHQPYIPERYSREPEVGEINASNKNNPAQLWKPLHRPPPLNLSSAGSVAESLTPPIDSPYEPDHGQRDKKRFRFQALGALEGMAERQVDTMDHDTASHARVVSGQSSERTSAGTAVRPGPLRLGNTRFPRSESTGPGVSEIGTTSPTTPESPPIGIADGPASPGQYMRHKKAASLPAAAAPIIAGLLEWHSPSIVDNSDQTSRRRQQTPETSALRPGQHARPSGGKDKSTNTPTFPGSFTQPRVLDSPDLEHLPLPILPLLLAQRPQLLQDVKNIKCSVTIDWSKLWWTVLWTAMLGYFLVNLWLSMILRDHIDDWKSANVSSRKYNHIITARDEYWGNSCWKLIEFWLAGGLGGSMELFV